MAKRYKEKEKKKGGRKGAVLLFIILLIIVVIFTIYFVNKNADNVDSSEKASQSGSDANISGKDEGSKKKTAKEKQEDEQLNEENASGDMLSPSELNRMVLEENEKVESGKIIKMHYKLESLDVGNVLLYYRLNNGTIYVVNMDISSKKIMSTKKYKEDDLENRQEIVDNLSTSINEYFEKYKEKLQSEGRMLNVIITDTEVVINLNYA